MGSEGTDAAHGASARTNAGASCERAAVRAARGVRPARVRAIACERIEDAGADAARTAAQWRQTKKMSAAPSERRRAIEGPARKAALTLVVEDVEYGEARKGVWMLRPGKMNQVAAMTCKDSQSQTQRR